MGLNVKELRVLAVLVVIAGVLWLNQPVGYHLYDRQVAAERADALRFERELFNRPRIKMHVTEYGTSAEHYISKAGYPYKENIKTETLVKVFWQVNKPKRYLLPGDMVLVPMPDSSQSRPFTKYH